DRAGHAPGRGLERRAHGRRRAPGEVLVLDLVHPVEPANALARATRPRDLAVAHELGPAPAPPDLEEPAGDRDRAHGRRALGQERPQELERGLAGASEQPRVRLAPGQLAAGYLLRPLAAHDAQRLVQRDARIRGTQPLDNVAGERVARFLDLSK